MENSLKSQKNQKIVKNHVVLIVERYIILTDTNNVLLFIEQVKREYALCELI